jgi:hypothetical protein
MTKEVKALRAEGGMTSTQVARLLGIGRTTLRRLEGIVYELPERVGGRKIRVYTAEAVAKLRAWLAAPKAASARSAARRTPRAPRL